MTKHIDAAMALPPEKQQWKLVEKGKQGAWLEDANGSRILYLDLVDPDVRLYLGESSPHSVIENHKDMLGAVAKSLRRAKVGLWLAATSWVLLMFWVWVWL
jgi:hypothetical protein